MLYMLYRKGTKHVMSKMDITNNKNKVIRACPKLAKTCTEKDTSETGRKLSYNESCMVLYGPIWSHMTYSHAWSCMVPLGPVWLCMVPEGPLRFCRVLYNPVWKSMVP